MSAATFAMLRVDEAVVSMEPGDFYFETLDSGARSLTVCMPDNAPHVLMLKPYEGSCYAWDWDGNEQAPTIRQTIRAGWWHGWIRAGRLVPTAT